MPYYTSSIQTKPSYRIYEFRWINNSDVAITVSCTFVNTLQLEIEREKTEYVVCTKFPCFKYFHMCH